MKRTETERRCSTTPLSLMTRHFGWEICAPATRLTTAVRCSRAWRTPVTLWSSRSKVMRWKTRVISKVWGGDDTELLETVFFNCNSQKKKKKTHKKHADSAKTLVFWNHIAVWLLVPQCDFGKKISESLILVESTENCLNPKIFKAWILCGDDN